MAQNKVTIHFEGKGAKGLRKEIQLLAQAQERLNGTIDKGTKQSGLFGTATDRNRKSMGLMGNAFATVRSKMLLFNFAMGLGIRQLGIFIKESQKLKGMEKGFERLQGSEFKAMLGLDKLRDATKGAVSDFNLLRQANNAMILGITKNTDEMAEMFSMAQNLGRALGVDAAHAVESLITGVGRQSRLMLDNIGIIVDTEKAYKEYASELNIGVELLTDFEKKQAFLNATMKAGKEATKELSDENTFGIDRLNAMGASLSNLAASLGKLVAPLIIPLAEALRVVSDAANSLIDNFGSVIDANEGLKKSAAEAKDKFLEFDAMIFRNKESIAALQEKMKSMDVGSQEMMEAEQKLFEKLTEQMQLEKEAVEALLSPITSLNKKQEEGNKLTDEEIEKDRIKRLEKQKTVSSAIKASAALLGLNKKNMKEIAALQAAAALVDAYSAAQSQYAKVSEVLLPPFPQIAYAAAIAQGIAQAGQVTKAAGMFEDGGLVGGRRHSQGGTMIEAERGEFVMSRNAVNAVGVEAMNRINQGQGAGNVNISFTGNVMSQDFIEDEAIPMIKEAIRRGADIGVS
tara:strand:- start:51 stop:1766 length:1716 start_codon:yes stop_codon:yes gene_type:complete